MIKPFSVTDLPDAKREELLSKFNAGVSINNLSKEFFVTEERVRSFLANEGLIAKRVVDFTESECREIIDCFMGGKHVEEVASHLGLNIKIVKNVLKKYDIWAELEIKDLSSSQRSTMLRKLKYEEGMDRKRAIAEMLEEYGFDYSKTLRTMKRKHPNHVISQPYDTRSLDPETIQIFEMRAQGMKPKKIAKITNKTYPTVTSRIGRNRMPGDWYPKLAPDLLANKLTYRDIYWFTGIPEWLTKAYLFKMGELDVIVTWDQIAECFREGLSSSEAAAKLNIGTRTARRYYRYYRALK